MAFKDLGVPLDEPTIITSILTGIAERIPGWTPSEGSPEVALAEEIGHQIARLNQLAVHAGRNAVVAIAAAFGFETIGGTAAALPAVTLLLQLPPSASPEPFSQEITIPADFQIAVGDKAFTIDHATTATVAFSEVLTGAQTGYWQGTMSADFTAFLPGSDSDVGGPGVAASVLTASQVVIGATLSAAAAGGIDPETMEQYLGRFVTWMSTLRPGGVRADEIARYASTIAGVHRAIALDRYDPSDPGTPADRTVTVIPIDVHGADLGPSVKTTLETALEQIREVNFVFHVIDPTRNDVALAVTVVKDPAFADAAVQANVSAAIAAAIDPAVWGTTPGQPTSWQERDTLTIVDVAIAAAGAEGVAAVTGVTIDGDADPVALDGPGALISAIGAGTTLTVTIA